MVLRAAARRAAPLVLQCRAVFGVKRLLAASRPFMMSFLILVWILARPTVLGSIRARAIQIAAHARKILFAAGALH